ncbi:MAG: T9SS type A sorting domain-containing protein, partial [Bacteroidales bacterium]|nr:T9SS type A sorting domain-containing protein [Bacteroidales bacterium]
ITLQKVIPAGYTWFSANIETNSNANPWNPNNYFVNAWFTDATYATPGNGPVVDDRIIGQTAFAVFASTGAGDKWVGSLTALSAIKMYRLFMTGISARYLQLTGSAVANNPITLNAGYTWLGYIPREDLPIATALTNFSGLVAGDRIISQNKFAIYNGTGWQGSLLRMYPGNGYIVQMANGGTLTYPDYVYAKSAVVTPENVVSPAGFDIPTNMKNTMTLIGQLDKASFGDKDVVYAFINGECRGMAAPSADGNIYLSIGENSDEAQEVSFKVWVDAKGELANIDQKVIFEPLKAVGDLNNPFTFKMSEAGTTDSWMVGKAYPNPFNEQTIIPLWLKESAQVTVNVYNNMGQLVKTVAQSAAKSGVSNIILQKENLDKGVYYYTVNINSSSATVLETGKLIIQ